MSESSNILTRKQIEGAATERYRVRVDVPEFYRVSGNGTGSGQVCVRELSVGDCRATQQYKGDELEKMAFTFCLCVCNVGGSPLFTEQDIKLVLTLPMVAVQRCVERALEISGLTQAGQDEIEKK